MKVSLDPKVRKFVDDQVKAGHFRSDGEVLDEAVRRMMDESECELDDETAAAICRAEEQIDRGEGIDFDQFAAEWRRKLATSQP
jgi:putative addiction module CopG family antidote